MCSCLHVIFKVNGLYGSYIFFSGVIFNKGDKFVCKLLFFPETRSYVEEIVQEYCVVEGSLEVRDRIKEWKTGGIYDEGRGASGRVCHSIYPEK